MQHRLTILSLTAILALPFVLSSQVVSEKTRQTRLDDISRVQESKAPDIGDSIKDVKDPFFAEAPKQSSGIIMATAGKQTRMISVDDPISILEGVADMLSPKGLMSAGASDMILAADGNVYEIGVPFKVELAGSVFTIVIESADSSSYILRYGDKTLSKTFENDAGSGASKSDQ